MKDNLVEVTDPKEREKICKEFVDSLEEQVFGYTFNVYRDSNGGFTSVESLTTSKSYREDEDVTNFVNETIKSAGLAPAINRAFVTFGEDMRILDTKTDVENIAEAVDLAGKLIDKVKDFADKALEG